MGQHTPTRADSPEYSWIWANALASTPPLLDRPREFPLPESVAEVSRWADSEDSRRVELVYAPVFWVLLPLAALGFLIWGMITEPREDSGEMILTPVPVPKKLAKIRRKIEHPGSGDDRTWYDLRINAELPGGITLRRRVHLEGERWGRRAGRPVRFRHNTLNPDAFDEVLLTGWPDEKPSISRRGRSSRGEVGT